MHTKILIHYKGSSRHYYWEACTAHVTPSARLHRYGHSRWKPHIHKVHEQVNIGTNIHTYI